MVSAQARPDRPAIRLSCPETAGMPGQGGLATALCREIAQALARAAPGLVIARVPAGQERPARPGDLGVALRLAPDGQSARLFWQGPQDATATPGPARALPASPAQIAAFAKALLGASPGIAAFLDRA